MDTQIVPTASIDYLKHTGAIGKAGEVFLSLEWFIPAYISCGWITEVSQILGQVADDERHQLLSTALQSIYTNEHLAVMLLERYMRVPVISTYGDKISEAIAASRLGLFNAGICLLLPIIEMVICSLGKTMSEIRKAVDKLLAEQEAKKRGDWMQYTAMLQCFATYIKDHLFASFSRSKKIYTGTTNLNRPGILHGEFLTRDFGSEYNFCRLISILDFLCFVITMQSSGFSALAPEQTENSLRRAAHYRRLQSLQVLAIGNGG